MSGVLGVFFLLFFLSQKTIRTFIRISPMIVPKCQNKYRPALVQVIYWHRTGDKPAGLDTYFFLNLAVGQPSNNMDLSEIEIYLGRMIIFFLFNKKSGRTVSVYLFLFQDYCVWSTLSHNKSLVFFCRSCDFLFLSILTSHGPGIHFKGYKNV